MLVKPNKIKEFNNLLEKSASGCAQSTKAVGKILMAKTYEPIAKKAVDVWGGAAFAEWDNS